MINEIARDVTAGKGIADDDAIAVGGDLGGARRARCAVDTGHLDMGAHIGGYRHRGGRNLCRVDQIFSLVENMGTGEAVDIAPFERHRDGDHSVRPQLDPRCREIDLVGWGRRTDTDDDDKDEQRHAQDAPH